MSQWINATITNTSAAPVDKVTAKTVPDQRKYVIIHNPDPAASVAFTMDGTTPVVGTNGITLLPGGTSTSDQYTMSGRLLMISSAASSSATIYVR